MTRILTAAAAAPTAKVIAAAIQFRFFTPSRRRRRGTAAEMAFLVVLAVAASIALSAAIPLPHESVPICPGGARPLYRPDGEPRKCLPHQSNLCLNALDDKADIDSVCCWHNKVDYFCCQNVPATQCPAYSNVTVVIHNTQPIGAPPLKVFHFRKGIEEDVEFTKK